MDELGYEHLWAWDHLYAIFGDPYQPIYEAYTTLAAWAMVTSRVRLGLMVGAVTFRNPGLVAKMITNLDQMSQGRAMLGIGAAWFELEHTAYGLDFGRSVGQRLDWMDEAVAAFRVLLNRDSLTSPSLGGTTSSTTCACSPSVQSRLAIMIGGGGEKKTLRTVAKYADMWNEMGSVELLQRKRDVLFDHCAAVGRDPRRDRAHDSLQAAHPRHRARGAAGLEAQMAQNRAPMTAVEDDDTFWIGTPESIAEKMIERKALGFHTFIAEMPAPYDEETFERWIGEVKPMVDGPATS